MKNNLTLGGVILRVVQLCLAVFAICYLLTPSIAIVGTKDEVELSAALIGVCDEEDLNASNGFITDGKSDDNVMNATEFANYLMKYGKDMQKMFKQVDDVPFEMSLIPTWCYVLGVLMYASFVFACIDIFGAVLGAVFTIFFNDKEKKSVFMTGRPNLFAVTLYYLTLACVQLAVLQPINREAASYSVQARVMLIDTVHPALVIVAIFLIFIVAKKIIATVFHCDEEAS